jgi:hypothetical protein
MKPAHPNRTVRFRAIMVAVMAALTSPALSLTAAEVNAVIFADRNTAVAPGPNPFIIKAQVLLSPRSVSPGVIDGIDGENFRKAVAKANLGHPRHARTRKG